MTTLDLSEKGKDGNILGYWHVMGLTPVTMGSHVHFFLLDMITERRYSLVLPNGGKAPMKRLVWTSICGYKDVMIWEDYYSATKLPRCKHCQRKLAAQVAGGVGD